MKNAPCTPLSPQEESAIMKAFSALLTPEEDEQAAEFFQPYIFYETLPDRSRDCWCSSCRERFNVTRRGNAAFFRASHKGKRNANQRQSKADCPICRTESKLIASNKFRTFRSLCEHRLVARLSAFDGWLLVQAGVVVREFERDYGAVTDTFRFHEFRRFAFKPGRRNEWNLRWLIQTYSQCAWVRSGAAGHYANSRLPQRHRRGISA